MQLCNNNCCSARRVIKIQRRKISFTRISAIFFIFFSFTVCTEKKVVFHLLSAVLNNFELHLNTERNKRTCGSSSNYFCKRVHVTKERHCTKVQKFLSLLLLLFFCMTIKKWWGKNVIKSPSSIYFLYFFCPHHINKNIRKKIVWIMKMTLQREKANCRNNKFIKTYHSRPRLF